jgi:hypothetical protein
MDFCDVRVCQAGAFPGLGGAESATQPSRAAGHKVISQFRGGNRMVFLTHQNPLARPSDHRSPSSCLRSASQLGVLSRFAKHDVGVADACRPPFGVLSKPRTSHHDAWKGMCGEGGLLDPSCTYPVAQSSREMHISATPGGCNCLCRHRHPSIPSTVAIVSHETQPSLRLDMSRGTRGAPGCRRPGAASN